MPKGSGLRWGNQPAGRLQHDVEDIYEPKKQILLSFLDHNIGADLRKTTKFRALVRPGKVVEEIIAAAKEEKSDLIVMAKQGICDDCLAEASRSALFDMLRARSSRYSHQPKSGQKRTNGCRSSSSTGGLLDYSWLPTQNPASLWPGFCPTGVRPGSKLNHPILPLIAARQR